MAKLLNLARMTTATTGTGTITLGAAVSGYLTFAQAGAANGDIVDYAIKDGNNSEIGTGTYASSGTTLTRSVTKSTNSNAAINLSGTAEVFITPRAETLADASSLTSGVLDPARIAFQALTNDKLLLGGASQPGPLDLNTSVETGFYAAVGYLNSPDGAAATGNYWFVVVQKWDGTYTHQTAWRLTGTEEMWVRNEFGGVWTAWRKVYTQGNILGTVSQSGGVPIGAIIESGSNANGDYIRFADGTQMCWGQRSATNSYSGGPVTLPVAFANTSYRTQATTYQNGSIGYAGVGSITASSLQVASSSSGLVSWFATGRWF